MEQFKKITIEDRSIIREYLEMRDHKACDYSLANMILWADVYKTEYAIDKGFMFIKCDDGNSIYFVFPMGNGDIKEAFQWMHAYCEEHKIELCIKAVEEDMFKEIEAAFPGRYEIVDNRENADYVYDRAELQDLVGKKYHGKKNHVNKFMKENEDWTYESITDTNTAESVEMVREWCRANGCCDDKEKAAEICVVIKGILHRNELNLRGGIIKTKGRIVALTLGEQNDKDTFIIHFEKAFADVNGAYPMINQQFILHELSEYTYINREEDMGIEGLRRAKESYYPVYMVNNGTVRLK